MIFQHETASTSPSTSHVKLLQWLVSADVWYRPPHGLLAPVLGCSPWRTEPPKNPVGPWGLSVEPSKNGMTPCKKRGIETSKNWASTMNTISLGHARWKLVPSKLEDTQEHHVENYGDYWVSSLMFLEATLLLLTVVSSKFWSCNSVNGVCKQVLWARWTRLWEMTILDILTMMFQLSAIVPKNIFF